MNVLIGIFVFIVLPILLVVAIGKYFSDLQKGAGAKTCEEMKAAMGPKAFRIYRILIIFLALVVIVGNFYKLYNDG